MPKEQTALASPGAPETANLWTTFPKEFEKSLMDVLDKRFTSIFVLTLLLDVLSIAYFVSTASTTMSEKGADHFRKLAAELDRQQAELEREAKFVDASIPEELPSAPGAGNSASGRVSGMAGRRNGGTSGTTGGTRQGGDEESSDAGSGSSGGRSRENISSAASRAGILGLLTGTGAEATGRAAEAVLGENQAQMSNLDEALANAGTLRRGSTATARRGEIGNGNGGDGRPVRGSRSTNAGGIGEMVQGLDRGKSQDVQRSGGLEVGVAEPLIEEPAADGKATGSRDRDAVAAVVTRHNSAIQFCYQKEVRRHPNLKGKLVVRFVITPQGNIASVNVIASTLNNPAVESCIVERIMRWDDFGAIDPAKGNTTFRQVYTFGY